jgi:hypothetical protein
MMLSDIWTWLGTGEADAFNAGIFMVLSAVLYVDWKAGKEGPAFFIISFILFLINFMEMVLH